ncbi:hypothetical protein PH562_18845 [Rhizobium sp. CNPSo 4062]|uniref:hypothetical protein n=1 Tax=Rhizobium sp. CNPSo 4062 TaxID=3021410 RepID=UPI00254FA2A9|nr:hypothetical protein [Rhizobium sp. CNPSo 4062]MDK4704318.1 hypothetical protein [Rhizobium sp. CNPSo 4062]
MSEQVTMRAKMRVTEVNRFEGSDRLKMVAVAKSGSYPESGYDEDNTYAKFSPQGELTITVANPALLGKIEPGKRFYLDFIEADPAAPA